MQKVLFIINPTAGAPEPILHKINRILNSTNINWKVKVTKKANDAYNIAKENLNNFDVVSSYGGDGTVAEVSRALFKTNTSLLILPGGTGNAVAKSLDLSMDCGFVLKNFVDNKLNSKKFDMGTVNDRPFLLRIDIDMPAIMINNTKKELKSMLGPASYAVSFSENKENYKLDTYKINIDNNDTNVKGVGLSIANCGNLGVPKINIKPQISLNDGLLDLLIYKSADLGFIVSLVGGLITEKDTLNVKSMEFEELNLKVKEGQLVMVDDLLIRDRELNIKVHKEAINILCNVN